MAHRHASCLRFPGPFLYRPRDSDIRVFWQIFCRRDLEIDLPDPPRFIVDGGANVGYSTAWLARRYPDAEIVAVEPDPANCELMAKNC